MMPLGTDRVLTDPFVAKSRKWRRLLYVAILAGVLALGWYAIARACRPALPGEEAPAVEIDSEPAEIAAP